MKKKHGLLGTSSLVLLLFFVSAHALTVMREPWGSPASLHADLFRSLPWALIVTTIVSVLLYGAGRLPARVFRDQGMLALGICGLSALWLYALLSARITHPERLLVLQDWLVHSQSLIGAILLVLVTYTTLRWVVDGVRGYIDQSVSKQLARRDLKSIKVESGCRESSF